MGKLRVIYIVHIFYLTITRKEKPWFLLNQICLKLWKSGFPLRVDHFLYCTDVQTWILNSERIETSKSCDFVSVTNKLDIPIISNYRRPNFFILLKKFTSLFNKSVCSSEKPFHIFGFYLKNYLIRFQFLVFINSSRYII